MKEIVEDLNNYYKNLIGKERIDESIIKKYIFKINKLNQLVKDKYPDIGKKITYGEAFKVINEMNESSPGSNGLTINFFKKFFPLFGEDFVEILNDEINIFPETFNETIIKIIAHAFFLFSYFLGICLMISFDLIN